MDKYIKESFDKFATKEQETSVKNITTETANAVEEQRKIKNGVSREDNSNDKSL